MKLYKLTYVFFVFFVLFILYLSYYNTMQLKGELAQQLSIIRDLRSSLIATEMRKLNAQSVQIKKFNAQIDCTGPCKGTK